MAWRNPNELARQMRLNTQFPQIDGCMLYSTQAIMKNPQGLCDSLQQVFNAYEALPPVNRNIAIDTSAAPYNLRLVGEDSHALLLWNVEEEAAGCAVAYHVVYAFPGDSVGDLSDPKNILCKTTARGISLRYYLSQLKHPSYTFVVTNVNKYKCESLPSERVYWKRNQ